MKPYFKISLLAATMALVSGCNQEETTKTEKTEKTEKKAELLVSENEKAAEFKTENDKIAYAIGSSFGKYLTRSLTRPADLGIELDKTVLLKGVSDAIEDKTQLKEDDIKRTLKNFDERLQKESKEKAAKDLKDTKEKGKAYQADFAKKEGVTKTDSGLLYKVLTQSDSKMHPKAADVVKVHYKGTLIDDAQFDSSYDRKEPATFPLNKVIPGWTEGLQLMTVGSKYQFVIPSELAYGDQGHPKIPAGSTLVFEVELLSIESDN